MKRFLRWFALVGTLAGTGGARAEVAVVTTVPDLAALAREVGGAHVSVKSMALASQDPHYVDAKPSLALALNRADLLISVGLELEVGWLPTLQTGARNAAIVRGGSGFLDCSSAVAAKDVSTGPVDRTQGDIHPRGNPHYLYDPRNGAACARAIAARLSELDPAHAGDYAANAKAFLARLSTARAGWEARLTRLRGKPVIAYHKSFTYLSEWLGLNEVAYLEPKAGVKPSPSHVASVLVQGRKAGVRAVLIESYYPEATARLVADKIPAVLVKIAGGTDVDRGQTYIEHVEGIVRVLEQALK